ncbi:MAG: outer membrane beta-barrel protein, partial [Proteobacteria bacterium]|nr:outer membrane beta-barrel protein [Pseudomonadota bacterium]
FIDLGLDPDEWISFGMSGGFNLGGVGAKGSLGLELGFVDRQYQNNREFTAGRDREARYVGLTYSHQIRPKTKLLAHVKSTDIDYVWANLDSTETRLMVGAAWEITGKTEARLLVGRVEKDFDDPVHDDFSGLGWEVGMTWSPKSYSIFDLSTSRETDETNGNGSYVLRQNVDLGWTHFWRERFNTTANIGFSDENYEQNLRDDNIDYMGISAKYQMKQWLLFGLGYTRYSRSSTVNEFEYNEGMFLFTIEASR